MAAAADTAP